MKKKYIFILLVVVNVIFFYWFFKANSVKYNGTTYKIKEDELGIRLFDEGIGDFSVVKAYKSSDTIYIQLYKFQGKNKL